MGLAVAFAVMLLMAALGGAVAFLAVGETRTAANHHAASEALYAADLAIELAVNGLVSAPDWGALLAGGATSPFVDGAPAGTRPTLGGLLDLGEATSMARCGRPACSAGDIAAVTSERPRGSNNPAWHLYVYGPLRDLVPAAVLESHVYVVVWVGDDPSECDGRSDVDGGRCASGVSRGGGAVALLAHAYGAYGTRRAVEASVARSDLAGVRITSWREIR